MEPDTFDLRDLTFLEFVFAKRELTYLKQPKEATLWSELRK